MNEPIATPRIPVPIRVAILAYTPAAVGEIEHLLHTAGVAGQLDRFGADLAHCDTLTCDMALAMFEGAREIGQFVSDIASVKLVRKVPIVVAFAHEEFKSYFESVGSELVADNVAFLPQPPDQLTRFIKTNIVTAQMHRQRAQAIRAGSGRATVQLGEILVHSGVINALQLKKALEFQKRTGERLGDALVKLGYIDEEQKTHFLAGQLGVAVAAPRQYAAAEMSVVALIPENLARRYNCLALEKNGSELVVVMTDVADLRILDSLRDATECNIKPILGSISDIQTSIQRFYQDIGSHQEASSLMAEFSDNVEIMAEKEDNVDLEKIQAAGAELGIVKLVNMLIANAVRDHASDIHIEPMEKELSIRYRIDGDLRRVMSPPWQSHAAIVTRIKILSNMDIAERRLPQDGRMAVKMGTREVDLRVSILPTVWGEKVVMRILDKEAFEKSVGNLGFTPSDFTIFRAQITKPYGMIIVTGPTGSGKSTTLYSAIQTVKNVSTNIITVEDPVEFHMQGITQVHVNTKIGLTFGSALRSILRQDPDIVLIGEIRDDETANIAIKMSLTGHLVFSTLHTNDASSAIARFVDIGVPPLLLGSSLNLVVAQRLVRRVCQKCRVVVEPEKEMLEQLNMPHSADMKFYRGEGCVACNGTGFAGRGGIFELLSVNKEIRTLILRNASTLEIQAQAEKSGMKTLRQSGIEMALRGETTIEQVIAVTTEL